MGLTGGKSGGNQKVTEYNLSIHYGICHGPVDALTAIYYNEKRAWFGDVTEETAINVDRRHLFGGPKKEGGIAGIAHFLPGDSSQVMPEYLAARFDLTSETCPAFRGLASVFFVGGESTGIDNPFDGFLGGVVNTLLGGVARGFYWSANTPYIRAMWTTVRRMPKGLDVTHRAIGPDTNPSHIIYECLTNSTWGMSAPSTVIDVNSFLTAAGVLKSEKFGLSLLWTQQASIEKFVGEVLDHIQAALFVNPRNGLLTLKLIRGGYDESTLRVFNPDNARISNFQRKAWGETVNEIVVSWTNPINEKEETVTIQDLANIGTQGSVVSDSRNYYGVRNAELAMQLAARDIRPAAAPLCSCDLEGDRDAWDLLPGDVVKLTWPEYNVFDIPMRVGAVNYGKAGDPSVKANLVEDIFALTPPDFEKPPGTKWTDPSLPPEPAEDVQFFTMPTYTAQRLGATDANAPYPNVMAGVFAARPNKDSTNFELMGEVTQGDGTIIQDAIGTKPFTHRATLPGALVAENVSAVPSRLGLNVTTRTGFGFLLIGTGGDEDTELALIQTAGVAGLTIYRGVLDTVPRAWPAGTPVWIVNPAVNVFDPIKRTAGMDFDYKLLPRTSQGLLSSLEAAVETFTPTARPHLPSRPANVRINNIGFGNGGDEILWEAVNGPIAVAWANRNRLLEDTQVLRWTEATVAPEAGQTTTVTVLDSSGGVLEVHDGLPGTSFDLPMSSFHQIGSTIVRVTSKRAGLESLQGMEFKLNVIKFPLGYGNNYGFAYGGA